MTKEEYLSAIKKREDVIRELFTVVELLMSNVVIHSAPILYKKTEPVINDIRGKLKELGIMRRDN